MLKETLFAETLAKKVGKLLLDNLGKISRIKEKSPKNFVTNVDLASEKLIISEIRKKYPDHQILSEEFGEKKTSSPYKWIIDPLDGTHNFMHSFPIFGVSIALEKNNEIISAAINIPKLCQSFIAEKGKSAFLNGKQIHVSKTARLYNSLIGMDSLFDKQLPKLTSILKKISPKVHAIRFPGAAVMELTSVASGTADAYICISTNPWDCAGGILLIKEAGGKITDYEGEPVNQYSKQFLASNGILHSKILSTLN